MQWIYGVEIRQDDGGFSVYVRDLPEVITAGDTYAQALELAADAIDVAVSGRLDDELDLPEPSAVEAGEVALPLSPLLAAKASVYTLWRRSGMRKTALAERLGRSEVEVRRILSPSSPTKIGLIQEAAIALGARLSVGFA